VGGTHENILLNGFSCVDSNNFSTGTVNKRGKLLILSARRS
jgi:hypothetical protein